MNRTSNTPKVTKNVVLDSTTYTLIRSLRQALSDQAESDSHSTTLDDSRTLCDVLLSQLDGENQPTEHQISLPYWKEKKAKELMHSTLAENPHVADIARECALSRSHFSRAFKRATGLSPKEWMIDCKIKRAQEMLIAGNFHLAYISQECGFADQSHFSRTFHRVVGMTPSKWRQFRELCNGEPTDILSWTS